MSSITINGDLVNAKTALELKLVDQLVAPKSALHTGIELAKSMVNDRPIEVVKAMVECVRNASLLDEEEALNRETELVCTLAAVAVKNMY